MRGGRQGRGAGGGSLVRKSPAVTDAIVALPRCCAHLRRVGRSRTLCLCACECNASVCVFCAVCAVLQMLAPFTTTSEGHENITLSAFFHGRSLAANFVGPPVSDCASTRDQLRRNGCGGGQRGTAPAGDDE